MDQRNTEYYQKCFMVHRSLEMGHIPINHLYTLKKSLEVALEADLSKDENYLFRIGIFSYGEGYVVSPLVYMYLSEEITRTRKTWPAVYRLESAAQCMHWQVLVIPNGFKRLRDHSFRPYKGLLTSDDMAFDEGQLQELHNLRLCWQLSVAPDNTFLSYVRVPQNGNVRPIYFDSEERALIANGEFNDKAIDYLIEDFQFQEEYGDPVTTGGLVASLSHIID